MEAAIETGQAVHRVKPKSKARKSPASVGAAINPEAAIRDIYRTLSHLWGPQHWWPAETPFEVIAGAILTQNTTWTNVERALANLRGAGILSVKGLRGVPLQRLEQLIRSSGYFRQKALRLKDFVARLDANHGGSLERLFSTPTETLRPELLAQSGIGPETADAILLYAGHHEVFVVDAYARRILERHEAITANTKYDDVRKLVEGALGKEKPFAGREGQTSVSSQLPRAHQPSAMSMMARSSIAQVYNEMHGLLVQVGKHYCFKRKPDCDNCPLGAMLSRTARRKLAGDGFNRVFLDAGGP